MSQLPLIPTGHTSVMANRQRSDDGLDYFPTPPWAARAGAELILQMDPDARTAWEPATGGGHMAHGLAGYFDSVVETDIHDHGAPGLGLVADFLSDDLDSIEVDWIVTNPPFILGEAFIRTAIPRARRGVAMLLRLVFLEGGKRFHLLHEDFPLYAVAPFSERVPMVKGRWDPEASSATAYAWFFWLKGHQGPARILPIPPGTKTRLSKPGDVATFNGQPAAPLLEGSESE